MSRKFGGFTVVGVKKKEEKNWGAQTVMSLVLGVLFCGPVVAWALGWKMSVGEIGVAVVTGVLLILAIALWALRTWDY